MTISVKNIVSIKVSNTSHGMLVVFIKHTLKGIIVAQYIRANRMTNCQIWYDLVLGSTSDASFIN